MPLSSMTGFARAEGADGARRWTFEVKSVNGRGLEMRFRLPPGFDRIEGDLRKKTSEMFARGSLSVNLSLEAAAAESAFRINRQALDQALAAMETIRQRIECDRPRAESVLALRGVIEAGEDAPDEDARERLDAALIASFVEAIGALQRARASEGRAIGVALASLIDEIERLTAAARESAGASLPAIRQRVADQLAELLAPGAVAEERLAQEAALLAIKADIREELDRLAAHVAQARELLKTGGPAGRKLDFLSQEFNREANTLASKAQDMALKRIGLELKTAIDQFREQVQNIE